MMKNEPNFHTFRTDRPGIRKVLGDLEAEIMEVIWARPPEQGTLVREVFEVLYERRHIAYTTIMSTMTRLAKKQLLRVEKKDLAYVYYPTLTQTEFVSRFVGHILEDLFVNFSGTTLEQIASWQDTQAAASQARTTLESILRRRQEEEA